MEGRRFLTEKPRPNPFLPLIFLFLVILFLINLFFAGFALMEPVTTITVDVPNSDSHLEIHEAVGFKTSQADFYLCPLLGRKRWLGYTEADERYCPFSCGDYQLTWLEEGVQVDYKFDPGTDSWAQAVFTWN